MKLIVRLLFIFIFSFIISLPLFANERDSTIDRGSSLKKYNKGMALLDKTTNYKSLVNKIRDKKIVLFFDTKESDGDAVHWENNSYRQYCLKIIKNTFSDKDFQDYIKDKFIILRVDSSDESSRIIDLDGNVTTPKEFAYKLRVLSLPTILLVDANVPRYPRYHGAFKNTQEALLLFKYFHEEKYKESKYSSFRQYLRSMEIAEVVPLIYETESMNDVEKKEWIDLIKVMDLNKIRKLKSILLIERRKIEALLLKHNNQFEAINKKLEAKLK